MSERASEWIGLLREIAMRPQMFESTPEAAHGLVVALSWTIWQDATGKPIRSCMRDIVDLIKEVSLDVCKAPSVPIMLCDTSFPERNPTFEAFSQRATRYINLLVAKVASLGDVPQT